MTTSIGKAQDFRHKSSTSFGASWEGTSGRGSAWPRRSPCLYADRSKGFMGSVPASGMAAGEPQKTACEFRDQSAAMGMKVTVFTSIQEIMFLAGDWRKDALMWRRLLSYRSSDARPNAFERMKGVPRHARPVDGIYL